MSRNSPSERNVHDHRAARGQLAWGGGWMRSSNGWVSRTRPAGPGPSRQRGAGRRRPRRGRGPGRPRIVWRADDTEQGAGRTVVRRLRASGGPGDCCPVGGSRPPGRELPPGQVEDDRGDSPGGAPGVGRDARGGVGASMRRTRSEGTRLDGGRTDAQPASSGQRPTSVRLGRADPQDSPRARRGEPAPSTRRRGPASGVGRAARCRGRGIGPW